jgi:uncharacterized YigZ family protein
LDTYRTLAAPATGEFAAKGSRFVAYAYAINSEQDVRQHLDLLRAEHHKARHWCYAWRVGLDKNNYRANDDGEPSGTAGRPILGQIDSAGLTNVLVVVVRYFGGTKLGTSGLIQAYREAAHDALAAADTEMRRVEAFFAVSCNYAAITYVLQAIKKADSRVTAQVFEAAVRIDIAAPLDEMTQLQTALQGIESCEILE